jgi:hypothetical protein
MLLLPRFTLPIPKRELHFQKRAADFRQHLDDFDVPRRGPGTQPPIPEAIYVIVRPLDQGMSVVEFDGSSMTEIIHLQPFFFFLATGTSFLT